MPLSSDIIFTSIGISEKDIPKRYKTENMEVIEEQGRRRSQEDAFAYGLIDKSLLNPLEKMQRFWTLTKHLHEATQKLQPFTEAGSTASIVIFDGTFLYVVSLGDSTVFAAAKDSPTQVVRLNSNLHKPHYSKEKKYIQDHKGHPLAYGKLLLSQNQSSGLNLSRSFGDLQYVNVGLNTSPTIDVFDLATLREATGSGSEIHIISACDGLTEAVKTCPENTAEKKAQEAFVLGHLQTIHQNKSSEPSIAKGLVNAATDSGSNDNLTVAVHTLTEKTDPFYMAVFDGHGGKTVSSQAARWFGILLRECLSLNNEAYLQDTFCTQNHQEAFNADNNPETEDESEENDYRRLCPLKNFTKQTALPEEKAITTKEESDSVEQPEANIPEVESFEAEKKLILEQTQLLFRNAERKFHNQVEILMGQDARLESMNRKQLEQIRQLLDLSIFNLRADADLSFISFMNNEELMNEFTLHIDSIQRLVKDFGITVQQLTQFSPETRLELYEHENQLALFYLVKDRVVPKEQLNEFLEDKPEIQKELYGNARAFAAFAKHSKAESFTSYTTFFDEHKPEVRNEYYKNINAVVQIIKVYDLAALKEFDRLNKEQRSKIYTALSGVTVKDGEDFIKITGVSLEPKLELKGEPGQQTPESESMRKPAEQKPSAAETPAAETPAAETSAAETPAAETPAAETPAAETPAAETPAAETPAESSKVCNVDPPKDRESKEGATGGNPLRVENPVKPSSDDLIAQFKGTITACKHLSDKAKKDLTTLANTLNKSFKASTRELENPSADNMKSLDAKLAEFEAAKQALKDYIYSSQATLGRKVVDAGKALLTFLEKLLYSMVLAAIASTVVGVYVGVIIAVIQDPIYTPLLGAVSSVLLGIASTIILGTLGGGVVGSILGYNISQTKYDELKCSFFTSRIGKDEGESQAIEDLLKEIKPN